MVTSMSRNTRKTDNTRNTGAPSSGLPTPGAALLLGALVVPLLLVPAAGCIMPRGEEAGATAAGASPALAADTKPLRQASGAANHRLVVTALNFDSLTPENEMKWESVEPRPGGFSFEAADRLVAFAAENGIRMRGHT